MKKPFFSIIMPVRNAERTLRPLIASIRKQQFTDWELVAADDGSTDSSPGIVSRTADLDDRIKAHGSAEPGIVGALNTALSAAAGSWAVRVDADDICHPDLLSSLEASIRKNPGAEVHGTRVRYFPRRSLQKGLLAYESWINALTDHDEIERDMFVECPMPHPTLTCPLKILTSLGGYRNTGWAEDYDLILRLWQNGVRFTKVKKIRYFWRDDPDRLSRTDPRYSLDRFTDARIEFLLSSYLAGKREAVVAGAGPVGKSFAKKLKGRGVGLRAFLEVNPAKIGKMIYGAPVLPVSEAPSLSGTLILHAVGQKGTREEARKTYRSLGLSELKDYLIVS